MARKSHTRNEIRGGIFFSAVIQGRDITVQLPLQITRALSGLPRGTPAFTGRDTDLRTLLDMLAPRVTEENGGVEAPSASPAPIAVVAAVGGLAGIGKTELAVQAARAALDRGWFPGGVLFVDLFGYDPARSLTPGQALEGFLRAVAIPAEHIPPQTQDRARLYASVLDAYAREGRRILVVIDNAATHEQARPLLPAERTSAAIVTSRDTLGMLSAQLLHLNVLTPGSAARMLERTLRMAWPHDTRVTEHPADAARIAGLCHGLPLAIRITAALLSEDPQQQLERMAVNLENERSRLDELSYDNISVRAAFDLSYQRLEPDRARLFRLLTINPGPEISTQATAALADLDDRAARRMLEALARAHLIARGSGYGRWRMHDLLRLYDQQLADDYADTDDREHARDRLLEYYLKNAEAADDHFRALHGTEVTKIFRRRDDALTWLDAERPNLIAAVTTAAATGRDQIAIELPTYLTGYLDWRRRFDDLLTVSTVSRDTAHRLGDQRNEAAALTSRGIALRNLRRFEEAITAHQDAAAIYRQTGDRDNESRTLVSLTLALIEVNRFEDAITVCQDAVTIIRETGDRHLEGGAMTNLGIALRHAERFEDAITVCQDAVTIMRETGDRRLEGMALNNLGLALEQAERFEEAITTHQDAAAIHRETGDRHKEAGTMNNLGIALLRAGRVEEAITLHQDAVAIFRETGDRHKEGLALGELGVALRKAGRFQEAITAHQDAATIFRETRDWHWEGVALNNLELDRARQQS